MDLGAFFTSFLSDAYRRRVFEDDSVLEHSFPHDLKTVKPLGSYPEKKTKKPWRKGRERKNGYSSLKRVIRCATGRLVFPNTGNQSYNS